MPKFLDAPSWYDKNGTLRTIVGQTSFQSTAGSITVPYLSYASGGGASTWYAFASGGDAGGVAYTGGSYPMWTTAGETGQFLKSNGSNMPTWSYVGFSYYAMRVNYDGNHNNHWFVYDIDGSLVTGSGRTGIVVIAGKASNDQGTEKVMVNRLATLGNAVSGAYELNLLDIFIAAPQLV